MRHWQEKALWTRAAARALPPVFRRRVFIEALRRWAPGFEADARAAARIEQLLDMQPGRRLVFGNTAVWRERDRIVFAPAGSISPGESVAPMPSRCGGVGRDTRWMFAR